MSSPKQQTVVFVGGGSGGHIYPLIAVADKLKAFHPGLNLIFVSAHGSIEEKIVPRHGFPIFLIPSAKLKGQGVWKTILAIARLFGSIFSCLGLWYRLRPSLIFSAGGYGGAPFLFLGALLGTRCEILEQNLVPGLANRWMSKVCKKIYLNFSGTKEFLNGKETEIVGHPCREEMEAARWPANGNEWTANPFRIFVFGGSQGAMGINRLLTAAAPFLKNANISILHQTGEADYERTQMEYAANQISFAKVERYVYEMAAAYREAHLVISRSGAGTLAELAATGKAAILIPLVSKDRHQEFNAKEIEKLGAAKSFLQETLTGEKLANLILDLNAHREKLQQLAEKMKELHLADAAEKIAMNIARQVSIVNFTNQVNPQAREQR